METPQSHELVGARLVGRAAATDLVDVWSKVTSAIVKHGFVLDTAISTRRKPAFSTV